MTWSIQFGRYDKIEEVHIAYTQMGIQGIGFRIIDAIGRIKIENFGLKRYNFVMKLKPNEYITKLSGKITHDGGDDFIELLKIHTNLLPRGISRRDDMSNSQKEVQMHSMSVQTSADILVKINVESASIKQETIVLCSIGVDVKKLDFKVRNYKMWDADYDKLYDERRKHIHDDWSLKLDRYAHIKEIIINSDSNIIYGVGFVIADAVGRITATQWFGGNAGHTSRIFLKLNEYIVRISGTYEYDGDNGIVKSKITSLRIHTNIWLSGYKACEYTPFSRNENFGRFSIPIQTSDFIVEIFGTHNNEHLSSIGLGLEEAKFKDTRVSIPQRHI